MTSETDNKVEAAVERLREFAGRCHTALGIPDVGDEITALISSKEAADQRCDRLAAEVERLTAWGNERHAAAREAMDTAYHLQYPPSPELLESIAERIDCGGDCETAWREWDTNAAGCTKSDTDGCPFEEAASLRDFAKALRVQAIASLDRTAPGETACDHMWFEPNSMGWGGCVKCGAQKPEPAQEVAGLVPSRLGNTPTSDVLAMAADMLDEAAQRLGLKIDMPVIARKLRELNAALSSSPSQGGSIGGDEPYTDASVSASPAASEELTRYVRGMIEEWRPLINSEMALLSMLYDVDLLPEQLLHVLSVNPAAAGPNASRFSLICELYRRLAAGQSLTGLAQDGSSHKNDEANPSRRAPTDCQTSGGG